MRRTQHNFAAATLLLAAIFLLVSSRPARAHKDSGETITDAPAPKTDAPLGYFPKPQYIGNAYCYACHFDISDAFAKTRMGHRFLLDPQTPIERLGCEGCHGPGSNHAITGGGRSMGSLIEFRVDRGQSIEDANRVCLTCHDETFWHGRTHGAQMLACFDCHLVMSRKSLSSQLKPPRVKRWNRSGYWDLAAIAGIVAGLLTGLVSRIRR